MAISERTVKNKRTADGVLTGRPGTVYDVNIKYRENGKQKTYAKRGFPTKKEAQNHEAEMRLKFQSGLYSSLDHKAARQKLSVYLPNWIDSYGPVNLRASTLNGYRAHIRNQLVPHLGDIRLCDLSPAMVDKMIQDLFADDYAPSTVRYCQRILSRALECAIMYGYIQFNAARHITTKISVKPVKPLIGYSFEEMRLLLSIAVGTKWEMICVLAGCYGLRRSEALGLRWRDIDFENKTINVCGQLPYGTKASNKIIEEMAPLKAKDDEYSRLLPMTDVTMHYFLEQKARIDQQKKMAALAGITYYENALVCCKPDGSPWVPGQISQEFAQILRRNNMKHIRLHDLRRTTSTNSYNLTGDYYTISLIMGHCLETSVKELNVTAQINSVTARYIAVSEQRKREILTIYHSMLFES